MEACMGGNFSFGFMDFLVPDVTPRVLLNGVTGGYIGKYHHRQRGLI